MYSTGGCYGRNELGCPSGTIQECADSCNADATCVSFEYTKEGTKCVRSTSCDDFGLTVNNPEDPMLFYLKNVCSIRYVKVQIPGADKTLILGEVQVFAMINGVETNVALDGSATQISTYIDTSNDTFGPEKCNNGEAGGDRSNICHTVSEQDPWWKVELASSYDITRVVVWNRWYCCSERLSGAVVSLLDNSEGVVEQFNIVDATGVQKFEFAVVSVAVVL